MSEPFIKGLSAADDALARSTLLKDRPDIPMPASVSDRRDAEHFLRWGVEELLEAIRLREQTDPSVGSNLAPEKLRSALQHFGKAREIYERLGDTRGRAICTFCRGYVHLIEEHVDQAEHDGLRALSELMGREDDLTKAAE